MATEKLLLAIPEDTMNPEQLLLERPDCQVARAMRVEDLQLSPDVAAFFSAHTREGRRLMIAFGLECAKAALRLTKRQTKHAINKLLNK